MKIACVTHPPGFALNLFKGLKERGHDVRIFSLDDTDPLGIYDKDKICELWKVFTFSFCRWDILQMDDIFEFNPDIVILWNGYFQRFEKSCSLLKSKFTVLHVEQAWLPQSENYYIADDLAPHSKYIMRVPEDFPIDYEAVDNLKNLYKAKEDNDSLPKRFIFFPGQLDGDTSIIKSSPFYKSCNSLLEDLLRLDLKIPIIVKNHPFDKEQSRPDGIGVYKGPLTSNDLVSKAVAAVGISSTVLVEALVHKTPIFSFGYNVAMRSHISGAINKSEALSNLKFLCEGERPLTTMDSEQTLSWLLTKQWPHSKPPEQVFRYIESCNKQ